MPRILFPLAALLAAWGCTASSPSTGEPTPTGSKPAIQQPKPSARPSVGLGTLKGEGELGGKQTAISAELKAGGQAVWKEGKVEMTGVWRKEPEQILLLLKSKDGMNKGVILEPKGENWELVVNDNAPIPEGKRILLKP